MSEDPLRDPDEHDPSEDECGSRRTVQLGPLSATDLKCILQRWQHAEPVHFTTRAFGDVQMSAKWAGDFEEPD
jgi:hypothetical protein